jgi:hypothetical protein
MASEAEIRPTKLRFSMSQLAAKADAEGNDREGNLSSQTSPLTPAGPSDKTIFRKPMVGIA